MIELTCEQFKKREQHGHKVDVVWMDNGGENLKLEKWAQSTNWKLGIVFENCPRYPSRTGWQKLLPWWQTRHKP
jgi:hypothetical protein